MTGDSDANPAPELITPATLAARWGPFRKTLERWRMTGTAPRFGKGSGCCTAWMMCRHTNAQRTRRCTAGRESISEGIC